MTMKTSIAGCTHKAGNRRDMDQSTKDKWENKATRKFGVDATGKITGFDAAYEEEQ